MRKTSTIVIVVLFVSFILYGGFESIKLILGANISIIEPKEYSSTDSKIVTIKGRVQRASYISLNDRQIFSDKDGNINEKLPLSPGYNIITLKVQGKFGEVVTKRFFVTETSKNETLNDLMEDTEENSKATSTVDVNEEI